MNPCFRFAMAGFIFPVCFTVCFGDRPEARCFVEPFFGRGTGSTLFRMESTIPVNGSDSVPDGVTGMIQSELEYPRDMFIAGLKWRMETGSEASRNVGLHLGVWTNVIDPAGNMMDTDWLGARSSSGSATTTSLYKFSYTESRPEARWIGAEAGVDFGAFNLLRKSVRFGVELHADYSSYRLYGIEGWQRLPQSPMYRVDTLADELVLTYRVLRLVPLLSADIRLADGPKATWNAVLTAGPAFAWDHDDHVLRRKESDAYAYGFEAGLRTEIELRVSARSSLVPAVRLAYFRTKGSMDQRFYGDDPFTEETDETGKTHLSVEDRIISFSGSLSMGYRYRF